MALSGARRARRRGAIAMAVALAVIGAAGAQADQAAGAAEAGAGAGASTPAGRAAILFLPWPEAAGGDRALLARLGTPRRALAVGLTSPTVGGYAPAQLGLDMSQGARVPMGLYDRPPPALTLVTTGGPSGSPLAGWSEARSRASRAPGELDPGSLAGAVRRGGGRVAFLGMGRALGAEAAVAADRAGRVERVVSASSARTAPAHLRSLWRGADLLVARLPPGEHGLAALDALLRARGGRDLVYVVSTGPPASARPPLLATGVGGPELAPGAGLVSATTRRPGLVAATDVAPTVLETLGLPPPPAMQGRPIEGAPDVDGARAVAGLHDRLTAILPGRPTALLALLAGWVAAVGGLALSRGRAGVRAGLRLGLLAALWFPGLALATAALAVAAPASPVVEALLLAGGALALAAATDRLLPWPRGPALPAAAVLCAYAVDLALGSRLTGLALTGPNPAAGARFYGIGNELEMLLSVSVLMGTGAAAVRVPGRRAATAFAIAGLAAVAIMGSGRLGADVGAAITLGAGAVVAAAGCLSPRGVGPRIVALAVLAPAVTLGALAGLDALTGADAHLSRTVLFGGPDGLLAAIERRAATQVGLLGSPVGALVAAAAAGVLAVLIVKRWAILAPLARAGARPLAAGLAGSLVAVVVGALANDSAPDMLAIGAALGLLAAAYVRGAAEAVPPPDEPRTAPVEPATDPPAAAVGAGRRA